MECAICPRFQKRHRVGKDSKTVEKEVATEQGYNGYMEELNIFESDTLNSGQKRRRPQTQAHAEELPKVVLAESLHIFGVPQKPRSLLALGLVECRPSS